MNRVVERCGSFVRIIVSVCCVAATAMCETAFAADAPGLALAGSKGQVETTASIMARAAVTPPAGPRPVLRLQYPDRSQLPDNPAAPATSGISGGDIPKASDVRKASHTTGLSFDAVTLSDTGNFPPDSMGTVGPTQFIAATNGRIRSFTKAGVADSVLDVDPNVFFASVMTTVAGAVVLNFTSDPQIRYDRFSGRW